jgi:hypothetical protein
MRKTMLLGEGKRALAAVVQKRVWVVLMLFVALL